MQSGALLNCMPQIFLQRRKNTTIRSVNALHLGNLQRAVFRVERACQSQRQKQSPTKLWLLWKLRMRFVLWSVITVVVSLVARCRTTISPSAFARHNESVRLLSAVVSYNCPARRLRLAAHAIASTEMRAAVANDADRLL